MKNPTDFAYHLTRYFQDFLVSCRNLSKNTISSYSYTFRLLMSFFDERLSVKPEKLVLKNIDKKAICDFLDWLESERHCSNATRNNRLAAIHSFFVTFNQKILSSFTAVRRYSIFHIRRKMFLH